MLLLCKLSPGKILRLAWPKASCLCRMSHERKENMAKHFLNSLTEPIVQTKLGKIRGFRFDGIYTFHGIKYADAKRFRQPVPVEPWEGVKDALAYGYICPMLNHRMPRNDIRVPHRWWPEDEHCQYLNIWTQSIDRGAKKPVMVWIHGGAFNDGSSIEMVAYEGDSMAKHHDVVFVNLNHRLNILGFLDMSSYDKKYENSGNAGIADLIMALTWVRDNIEAFGGDPENVTIFGQSGGGRKVTSLMQTPAAAGLFHKAIIQSGTSEHWNPGPQAHHKKLVSLILAELEIPESDYEKLERVPYPAQATAYKRANAKLYEQDGILNEWSPIVNGWFRGSAPYNSFCEHARGIPLMAGSCICEAEHGPTIPDKDSLSAEQRREHIEKKFGENTDKLIELFKKAYPDKNELTLLSFDRKYRRNLLRYADLKTEENNMGVPVYIYMFSLEFEVDEGKGAWHCSDIPFAFHNAERVPVCHIEGVMEKLQDEMSGAWASFARTGNPNHPGLPEKWPEYSKDKRTVMVFDRTSMVRCDHEHELVEFYRSLTPLDAIPGSASRFAPDDNEKWIY